MLNAALFAKKLSEERKKQKLTQKELSEKVQISIQSISGYEKGAKYPSLDSAINICNALNTSLDALCSDWQAIENKSPDFEIRSLGDVATLLVSIACTIPKLGAECYFSSDEFDAEMKIKNCKFLAQFILDYKNMSKLVESGALTKDIFETWQQGAISELCSKDIETFELFGF